MIRVRTPSALRFLTLPLAYICLIRIWAFTPTPTRTCTHAISQFIVIAGYVSRAMYFIRRGPVQIIRKAETGEDFLLQVH